MRRQILETARLLGREIKILDLGGRADYWRNVGLEGVTRITLLNTSEAEFSGETREFPTAVFEERIGNACDLSDYENQSVDMVHSNSVIEHVGSWSEMSAMAREARRVGRTGWIQTPSAVFPIEPHFHLPLIHWLAKPMRAQALKISPLSAYRHCSDAERKLIVDSIHLLTKAEMTHLFPNCNIYVEYFFIPKSYVAHWSLVSQPS